MKVLYRGFLWKDTEEIQDLVVIDDRIVGRGPGLAIPKGARIVDKTGSRLFPPYIDNHCHILPTGLDLKQLNLTGTTSREEALDLLTLANHNTPDGWLLAVHYDQNRYGGEHLYLADLDKISNTRPILLKHSSGHAGIANSQAMLQSGVSPDVLDSQGETFGRDSSGKLNGLLLEGAFEKVRNAIPKPTVPEMVEAILTATDSMETMNIESAADMQTGSIDLISELTAYRLAVERGCRVAMRLYLQWGRVFGPKAPKSEELEDIIRTFEGTNCRVQGIKLFADGAIGAGTAAIYGSYTDGLNQKDGFSGTLMYKKEVLKSRILIAAERGWQVSVHAIGDHAADLVMEAYEATADPSSHRLEHAMLLSDGQIDRLAKVNCHVCVQPEFLAHFGKTYQTKLGEERAANLIRVRSLIDAGLRVSFSSDRPITAGDPAVGTSLAAQRPMRFNQFENCTVSEAMTAYTTRAAEATRDQEILGQLPIGATSRLNWVEIL